MTVYWNKVYIVLGLVAGLVLLGIFGRDVPTGVFATLLGLIGSALSLMQPPTDKARSYFPPALPNTPKVSVATLPPPPFNLGPPDSARSEDTKP